VTAHPSTIHGVPVDAAGRHVASPSCPCRPVLCADLLEPARIVYAHRHNAPGPPDVPPEADRLLWRSRERRGGMPVENSPAGRAQTARAPFHTHPVTMQEPDP